MALFFIRNVTDRRNDNQINGGLANGATEAAARAALQAAIDVHPLMGVRSARVREEWEAVQLHSTDADGMAAPVILRGDLDKLPT